eukprot:CAMPEP_0180324984 /NCGR_PEP_ID=MMETSP0988-20121125/38165_1 /TAXON_ID=697907 /ORGANISM="non described non described, Strain CCMP2293" /LENGTH=41 /DNA_ID= /DNA_START= /DNA_END= /DNA_ORIENTATION=
MVDPVSEEVKSLVQDLFLGASDSEVSRISYQCKLADKALFG